MLSNQNSHLTGCLMDFNIPIIYRIRIKNYIVHSRSYVARPPWCVKFCPGLTIYIKILNKTHPKPRFSGLKCTLNILQSHTTQGKIKFLKELQQIWWKNKVASKCKQRLQYCQNIGPWWYSSCFNAKFSPKVPKYGILLTRVGFSLSPGVFLKKVGNQKRIFFNFF